MLYRFALILAFASAPAWAQIQSGPFAPGATWFVGPGGSLGVLPSGGNQLTRTSDGAVFNRPSEIQDSANWNLTFRLSPSQQVLYVQRSNPQSGPTTVCGGWPNVQVHLYDMSSPPLLTPFTSVSGVPCMNGGVDQGPFFFDQSGTIRTAVVVGAGTATTPQMLWADLVGRQIGIDALSYTKNVTRIEFAPGGNAAWIVHSVTNPPGAGAMYNFVDLCADPLGGSVGAPQSLPPPTVSAEVTESGGNFFARLLVNGTPEPGTDVALSTACFAALGGCCDLSTCTPDVTPADCTASGGTPIGEADCSPDPCIESCCLPDGGCAVLGAAACASAGGTLQGSDSCDNVFCPQPSGACCQETGTCFGSTQDSCLASQGVWQGAGTTCGTVTCPRLEIALDKSGPAQARVGQNFTYSIDYANTGDVVAPAVVLADTLPFGLDFVSATGGGVDVGFNEIEWQLGDLALGAAGSVDLTVNARCFAGSGNNTVTAHSSVSQFNAFASVAILPELTDPIAIDVAEVASDGLPLEGGDTITHTVTLTNTVGEARSGIFVTFQVDSGLALESVVDDGGGSFDMFSTTQWDWNGDLPANGTVTLVLVSRVDSCVQQRVLTRERIFAYSVCGTEIGSVPAREFAVRRALEVDALATSLNPPATIETFFSNQTMQLTRDGDTVDFRISVTNPHPTAIASATLQMNVPFGFDAVGDPPFIAPTDPAAVWNPGPRRVEWSGAMAAGQTVEISFRAVESGSSNATSIFGQAGDGSCTVFEFNTLSILPELPTVPYLFGLASGQLVLFRPGVDSEPQPFFSFPEEFTSDLARGANGDLWVMSLPTFRINPETLELQGFPTTFRDQLGFLPADAAIDPADNSVVFVGAVDGPFGQYAAVRRYDLMTEVVTALYDEPQQSAPTIGSLVDVVVEPGGAIGLRSAGSRIYRLDPTSGVVTDLSDPGFVNYRTLALDVDGTYLVSQNAFSSLDIADVDPTTGVHTTITGDVQSLLPNANLPLTSLTADDNGDIYLAYNNNGMAVLERDPSLAATELIPFDFFGLDLSEIEFAVSGPCVDADGDGVFAGSGCSGSLDCDDTNADIAPGAVEIADGVDNQCPGDAGFGLTDELPGLLSTGPGQPICWPAATGATEYEIARFVGPAPVGPCTLATSTATCWDDPASPTTPGELWVYLVRVSAPSAGSWGRDSAGAERAIVCP